MTGKDIRKRLLVEGAVDRRVIAELMERNGVPWPKGHEPVDIHAQEGDQKLLAFLQSPELDYEFKNGRLKSLGVILDADDSAASTWDAVRNRCESFIPELPKVLDGKGLITAKRDKIRFGVWIMPDNRSTGMLETFLRVLVKPDQERFWAHAANATAAAKKAGAPFRDPAHRDKANIHTFLAWQDPPGLQLHESIRDKVLDPTSAFAGPFVAWFRKLFEV